MGVFLCYGAKLPLTERISNVGNEEPVQADDVTDPQEAKCGMAAMLKSDLRCFLTDAREHNVDGKLRSRELSLAISHAETAYLWLCEVSNDTALLNF